MLRHDSQDAIRRIKELHVTEISPVASITEARKSEIAALRRERK